MVRTPPFRGGDVSSNLIGGKFIYFVFFLLKSNSYGGIGRRGRLKICFFMRVSVRLRL